MGTNSWWTFNLDWLIAIAALKFVKLGYGKITDHASREIRLKRMSSEEGIKIVGNLKQEEPKDLTTFLYWVVLSADSFKILYWINGISIPHFP